MPRISTGSAWWRSDSLWTSATKLCNWASVNRLSTVIGELRGCDYQFVVKTIVCAVTRRIKLSSPQISSPDVYSGQFAENFQGRGPHGISLHERLFGRILHGSEGLLCRPGAW